MSDGTGDKIKGAANRAAGKTQEEWGEATGSSEQEAKGQARQAKGRAQQTEGDIKHKAGDVKRNVKNKVNDLTD